MEEKTEEIGKKHIEISKNNLNLSKKINSDILDSLVYQDNDTL